MKMSNTNNENRTLKKAKKARVIPGFGLTMGVTVTMLSLIVLIPLASVFAYALKLSPNEFFTLISKETVRNAFITSIGSSFIAALINVVFGLIIAWVLVKYEFPGKRLMDGMKMCIRDSIHFSFGQGTTKKIVEELKDGKYDLAFSSYVEGEDELEFIPVGQEELVLITPKDHPLAQKEEIDLLDTIEYDYVYFTKNSGLRPVIDSCFSRIKRQPTIAYEGEEDSSVAGLVAAGFGIAIVPKIPLLEDVYKRQVYHSPLVHGS